MYSAMAKIFRAFFASMAWVICAVILMGCGILLLGAICEILYATGHLPLIIEKLYLALGGV